jgi:VanZ family protein
VDQEAELVPRPRWRQPRVVFAWLLFAACAGLVLYLGSDEFSASATAGYLGPLIDWLFPDWSALDKYRLHVRVRKLAHSAEYGVLALLAFHAVLVTLETLLARVLAISLLLVFAVAATDELRQAFSDARTGALGDLGLDLGGALVALAIVALLRWRRGRLGAEAP